ncbi:activated RNA polymerase II transcriptional coactivator p15 [Leptopilina boulardi]|uniref:activated RNA polymerase II transcriptional coactivator p15 n=1 Tax=Leptopilina boulardi TaxID=63433 RepID=UPI0021F53BB2|nr:activated RNA polymerase II transcriptional coactivator p15 [Leptopilina boulardi]
MPKSKEFIDSDDSSASGSSSEAEKKGKKRPKKEVKQKESKEGSSSKKPKNDGVWELDEKCLVTVRDFKGKTLIDIRYMYEDKNSGELKPSKKGISLNPKLWRKFVEIVDEVDQAVKEKS